MSEIPEKLQESCVKQLHDMLENALARADKDGDEGSPGFLPLLEKRADVLDAFTANMNVNFEKLMDKPASRPEKVFSYETLSLVQDSELDIMVTLEGMVNAARNSFLQNFISFNTRLNALFPNKHVDESNNPLDPSQIAEGFQDAIRSLELDVPKSLTVYRQFNKDILHHVDEVVESADSILVSEGVIPEIRMDAVKKEQTTSRAKPRSPYDANHVFGTVEEDPFDPQEGDPELFSMVQNLMHGQAGDGSGGGGPGSVPGGGGPGGGWPGSGGRGGGGPGGGGPGGGGALQASQQYAVPASFLAAGGGLPRSNAGEGLVSVHDEQVQMVEQSKLMEVLANIQRILEEKLPSGLIPKKLEDFERLDIQSTLGEMLQEDQEEGKVNALDRQSSDVINLVTLLYGAIWDDDSVPIPIKELIGRTQITVIKVALYDTDFFNKENHPARSILNDFAEAGISWTATDELAGDPLYRKMDELVRRILAEYSGDNALFEEILQEFRTFRTREAARSNALEQRIMRAKERDERIDDINQLVNQKISERTLGRELQSFVQEILDGPFHKFMVMLVLKEGPGTNAWKQAINTIDVLLWTVQAHEHEDDRARLEAVNPRLFNNLRKAFRIAKIELDVIDELIDGLKNVQEETFSMPEVSAASPTEEDAVIDEDLEEGVTEESGVEIPAGDDSDARAPDEEPEVAAGRDARVQLEDVNMNEVDPYLTEVDNIHVGTWVEFVGEGDTLIRCKLAARINAIDKYIFVNRQGIKVVEKTRRGLAQELRDGTVKPISDGLLFSRALETVIGNLRVYQHEQQTGSAYHPDNPEHPGDPESGDPES